MEKAQELSDQIPALDRIASNASDAAAALRLVERLFKAGKAQRILLDDTNPKTAIMASDETFMELSASAAAAIQEIRTDLATIP